MYEYLIPSLKIDEKTFPKNTTYTQFIAKSPLIPLYANIQLHHYHIKNPNTFVTLRPDIWNYLTTSFIKPKGLSWFYKKLQNTHTQTKTMSMLNWEGDLKTKFALTDWLKATQSNYNYSHCTNHWDSSLKILYRSYLTPMRLSHIFSNVLMTCWRQCGSKGTIFNILWGCKSVKSFWNSVFSLLAKITGIILTPTPALALLNLGIDTVPMKYRCITIYILIAARLSITLKWKTDNIPSINDVIQ